MRQYNGKIVGILGTVIVHLLAGIIFMSFKLHSLATKEKKTEKFEIEFAQIEEKKALEKPQIKLSPTTVENVLHDDPEMLNIARNLANKSEEKIDPRDLENKVKEELIKSGKLNPDNFADRSNVNEKATEDEAMLVRDKPDKEEVKKEMDSKSMEANYRGPTRIYYDLQGRNHVYLPIPIYKCQGSGKIVLIIEVDQRGNVIKANVVEGESSTADQCLVDTAVGAALVTRFQPDLNAPRTQRGTLTYIFVAQ